MQSSDETAARMRTHISSVVMPAQAGIQYAAASQIERGPLEYWITRMRG